MVYMAGDNNLSTAGENDLEEMRRVGSSDAVNVLVEFDNAGARGTNRYLVRRNGVGERLEAMGETDSGDPRTIVDFIAWAAKEYPAERTALILWNHGGGWEPSEIDRIARSVSSTRYTAREAGQRAASPLGKVFFRTTLETILGLASPDERAICSDDGSGHSLDTVELGKVLEQAVRLLGRPIDLLGMDACLMSNLEVAYQVRPYVRYLVASEENEPNDGWPYHTLLKKLVKEPSLATPELAAAIVETYVRSYEDQGYPGPVTLAALDLSHIDKVVEPLDALADALSASLPERAHELWTAQRGAAHFWHNTLWDIAHFCEQLEKGAGSGAVRKAALRARQALQPGEGGFVLAEAHRGEKVSRCCGVTVYLLPPLAGISRYYGELAYAKGHRWASMLEAYHAA